MAVATRRRRFLRRPESEVEPVPTPAAFPEDCVPIEIVEYRTRVKFGGRVRSIRVQPWAGTRTLECSLDDGTGRISVVFLGRSEVPGIEPGTRMVVEGMVGSHAGRLAILNPDYTLLV